MKHSSYLSGRGKKSPMMWGILTLSWLRTRIWGG